MALFVKITTTNKKSRRESPSRDQNPGIRRPHSGSHCLDPPKFGHLFWLSASSLKMPPDGWAGGVYCCLQLLSLTGSQVTECTLRLSGRGDVCRSLQPITGESFLTRFNGIIYFPCDAWSLAIADRDGISKNHVGKLHFHEPYNYREADTPVRFQ